jgi:hypothetical protein
VREREREREREKERKREREEKILFTALGLLTARKRMLCCDKKEAARYSERSREGER